MGREKNTPKRYKNLGFLMALGSHCEKLRKKRGLSIDRLSKEGEQLSPSVIHRLEKGNGAVTVAALYRFAEALQIPVRDLFDFEYETEKHFPTLVALDSPRIAKEAFRTLLPLYSLRAAAGYFGKGEVVQPEAWIETSSLKKIDRKMFVARAVGDSMLPTIKSGDYLVFRADPEGTRQGKIVLAQYRGPADPDTAGSFTVKKYLSSRKQGQKQIELAPLNKSYKSILLSPEMDADFRIVAEYIDTLE